jgi:hypothetical protein
VKHTKYDGQEELVHREEDNNRTYYKNVIYSGSITVECFCEYGAGLTGPMKGVEFPDHLRNVPFLPDSCSTEIAN